jgi:cGMP-dependent protein kinase
MIQCEFRDGQTIVKEGDKGESLFIIKEGTVACVKDDKEIRKLHMKDYFGESSILFETKRTLSIVSKGRTLCYNITKSVLVDALGQNFTYILLSAISRNAFMKCEFLHYIIFDECFSKIFKTFKLKFYKNNEIVIDKQHHLNRKIVILIEGNLIHVWILY